jgi:type II secretory pathway component GspD/PulD (secretin)
LRCPAICLPRPGVMGSPRPKPMMRLALAAGFALLPALSVGAAAAQPAGETTDRPVIVDPAEADRPVRVRRMGQDGRGQNDRGQNDRGQNDGGQNGNPANGQEAEPTVSFGIFSEPIQLSTLIDFVGETLGLNIVVKGSPSGEIVFNAPVEVPQSQLLDLLDAMLEQFAFTITSEDATGFYIVQPVTDVRPSVGGTRSSVRIIPTPNIKPSQLVQPLTAVLGSGGTNANAIQAVDQLGVIIVSAPARDIARVEGLVAELMRIDAMQNYIRIELDHIAAPTARDRAIALVGGGTADGGGGIAAQLQQTRGREQNAQAIGGFSSGGSFSNLSDRITVDPQGNALIFRGTEIEIDRVLSVLAQIDVPNTLEPRNYFAGSSAAQIAEMAKIRGLGEVIQVSDTQSGQLGDFNQFQRQLQNQAFGAQDAPAQGGPIMVVDSQRGNIIYYGTPQQQEQMAELMKELRTDDERVVIREYVLNHSDAEVVAELITSLITGQARTGDAPLLPTGGQFGRGGLGTQSQVFRQAFGIGGGDDVSAAFDPELVVVIPDIENNQVVVKAPLKQQEEIAKLIERLDRRRAQVYIQALIVSVSDDENFTLAFESQYLRGDFGVGTNFGLSGLGATSQFTDPKNVAPGLAGITAAVIRSDYVPLIINASQTNTETRILSMPQLLVNDNEEAEIVSLSEEPFTEITTTNGNDPLQGFGGFAEAGTTLRVTPSISSGGFLRLQYFVELSNFTDTAGSNGNPPPRDRNTVSGGVTIPSDATIVIGGITVDNIRNTVAKVPFLGDIPLVGELFKRTNKINTKARLYIFLTPRIMTDPNFNDIKLLTKGPQSEMELDPDAPLLMPASIGTSLPAGTAPELNPATTE